MTERDPYASTGTDEDTERAFVESLTGQAGELRKAGIGEMSIEWHGKRLSMVIAPSDLIPVSTDGRVKNEKVRLFLSRYIVWLKGNRCHVHAQGFCIMGERPFTLPEKADFDHIDDDTGNVRADNFQFACAPCNRHKQALHRKRIRAMASRQGQTNKQKDASILTSTDKQTAPATVKLSNPMFDFYVRWLGDECDQRKTLAFREAMNRGALKLRERFGYGTPQTTRSYLDMLTEGDDSPFEMVEGLIRRRAKAKIATVIPNTDNQTPTAA